jgi:GAF domain-containing protein
VPSRIRSWFRSSHKTTEPEASAPERRQFPRQDTAILEIELHESRAGQARLRQDLAELLKAHRQQGRVLERTQKAAHQSEAELTEGRKHMASLETEIAQLRNLSGEHAARIAELEAALVDAAAVKAAHGAAVLDRDDARERLVELGKSRDNAEAERDRFSSQLAALHATAASRDAEIAALKVAEDESKGRTQALGKELADARTAGTRAQADAARLPEVEAARTRLQLEFDSLAARWEVARAQLDEAEQSLRSSQATIKAAQRLSASVEWRGALDGVLDAASELVRFERGTLALVDELQEELKIEAARNSPIAVSEMSRFKVGEGIAGWALSHREPVLVKDSRSDPRFKASDPKHQPRSFIVVPLLSASEALGVLTLMRPASDPFDDRDLRTVARVAADAATALINARLVHLLKQREDELTTLVGKAKELWRAGDIQQVLEFVLSSALELAGGTAALIAVRGGKGQELEVLSSKGIPAELLSQRIAWGAPAAMDVLRNGKPWVAPMREMLPAHLVDTVEGAGLLSLVSVPCATQPVELDQSGSLLSRSDLDAAEELLGVLQVYRPTAEPLAPARVEQLRAFADHAAVAIRNVRRTEKVRGQLHTTATLNARLMGRERYINQLQYRIQQLEKELTRYKAA